MSKAVTGSFSSRFGEGKLAFNMTRFASHNDERVMWMFSASSYCNGKDRIEQEVKLSDLIAMKIFIDRAIESLELDGGCKEGE